MKFEEVNNKKTDSIILSLEQLTTEYENTLNMYNQVQMELNAFANSEWQLNPYLNTNIQFTTGEIAYVSISGGVYLYSFLPSLYSAITADQGYVAQAQSVVNQDQNTVNQDQTAYNNTLGGQLQTGWNDFTNLFDGFTTMREGITTISSIGNLANSSVNALGGGGSYVADTLLDSYGESFGASSSQISNLNNGINTGVNAVTSVADAGISAGVNVGNDLLSGNLTGAASSITSLTSQLTGDVEGVQNSALTGIFGSTIGSAINSGLSTVESGIVNTGNTVITGAANFLSGGYDSTIDNALNTEFNPNAASNLQNAQNQLSSAQSNLSAQQNNLNTAEGNLQNALGQLTQSGCPSTTSNVTQLNLPWVPEYNALYALIPTTPFLITMGQLNYNNGNIGFTSFNSSGSGPVNGGCDGINTGLTPPPYEIIAITNTSYNASQLGAPFPVQNEQTCAAVCSASPNCSGANFNTSNKNCTLMTGAGLTTPSQNTVALIPQITQYIMILSQLNFKLTQVNDQIIDLIKTGEGEFIKYTNDTTVENKLLENRYKKLITERERIDQMIDNIGHTQEEEYYEQSITSNSYLKYGLLLVLVIIVFIILANINRSTEHMNSDGSAHKSIFFIIFVIAFIVIGVLILKNYVTGNSNF